MCTIIFLNLFDFKNLFIKYNNLVIQIFMLFKILVHQEHFTEILRLFTI